MTESTQLPLGSQKVRPPVHNLDPEPTIKERPNVSSEDVEAYMNPPKFTPPTPEDFGLDPETLEEAKNAEPSGKTSPEIDEKPDTKEKALLEPVGFGGFNNTQIAILRATSFKDCRNREEAAVACSVAKKYDLDPFIAEIWAINMKGKMVIQASAAGWRKMITRNPEVKRLISNAVYEGDSLEIDHVNGTLSHKQVVSSDKKADPKENPLGGYAAALMDSGEWIVKYVRWEEYDRSGEDKYSAWNKQKSEMICNKAVTVLGRSSFGVSGIYLPGEITPDTIDLADDQFSEERISTGKALKDALRNKKK